jgi:hypothetical protein
MDEAGQTADAGRAAGQVGLEVGGAEPRWPPLPLAGWADTRATLHLWTQVVGKVRLALTPLVNHWWNVTLYPSARGLTTSPMPYRDGEVEIAFDLVDHQLAIARSDGRALRFPLRPMTVARFYRETLAALAALGVDVQLNPMPCELPDPIPLDRDTTHAAYDPDAAHRFWRVLLATARVLQSFRGGFVGKASPVHFFWGSFDLALTLFSGRRAPARPGADRITREAYSHEVVSFGFWPGGGPVADAAFYGYAAPEPDGFAAGLEGPPGARYEETLKEYVLDYEAVRAAPDPDEALLAFVAGVYARAVSLGRWDRAALER